MAARRARTAAERVHFTGRLEHEDLPDLLPACEAQVVPSTFPEAFGMVAAEAAACGALPLSGGPLGLAEVTATLRARAARGPAAAAVVRAGPGAVEEIADQLVRWLELDPRRRDEASRGAGLRARPRRFSWEGVAGA